MAHGRLHLRRGLFAAIALAGAGGALALAGAPPGMMLTQVNPVYVDDSPTAADTFVRVREHVSAGNLDEGVRVLQVLLDEQADRLVAASAGTATPLGAGAGGGPDLFVSVRSGIHELLLTTPLLLERYRGALGPRADRLLGEGQVDQVERSLLLTSAGHDAAMRIAQGAMEDARFEHARLLLEQLDRHPDRKGDRGKQAAAMMASIARYLDRPEVAERARKWASDAGENPPVINPEVWPGGAKDKALTSLNPVGPTSNEGMVSKPLWTVALNPGAPTPEANLGPGGRGQVSVPMAARDLLMVPSIAGDTVYVSDGSQVGAWDRFTLTARWSVTPGVGDAPVPEQGMRGDRGRRMFRGEFGGMPGRNDDLCTVAIAGRYVVAATGRSSTSQHSDGDDRIQALDAATGRPRWSMHLNTLSVPALYDATVRGPIQIVEGTVVFAARKHLPDRRLVSLAVAGLDLPTGKLLWVRPIGSAGSMPWVLQSMGADGMTAADGMAYRADRLGVVGAVEAGTGRTKWVRRMGVDTSSNTDQPAPWQMGCPIVDGKTIITIAPDMKKIVRMDRATGAIVGQRDEVPGVQPKYLLRIGDLLACIGDDRIAFLNAATFETDKPELTSAVPVPGIRGRCVVSGDRLLIPTVTGFTLVNPSTPAEEQSVLLEDTGNLLPVDSQIIAVDDVRLHSYLQWEVAEGLLSKRIDANPKDPSPAVTFAELAYRAGRPERIVGAVKQAMSALKGGPQNDETWGARARLIEAMQGMLATAMEPALPGMGAPKAPVGAKPITDKALLQELVTLLGELSFQPEDRLAHTLAVGRLGELNTKPDAAVAAYQKVLGDPALAGATWRGPQVSIRGELEAARRIESLLKQHGVQVYAAQEQTAAGELAALGPSATEPQLETLAARYPLAQQTPGIWTKIADIRAAENKPQQVSVALEAGLRSATRQPSPPPAVVGEIAGRLIVGLRERQQPAAAAGVLRAVRTRFPGLALTSAGQALDAEKLGAELAAKIAASMRWPKVGPVRQDNAQAIAGWTILEPLLSERTPSVTGLLALTSDEEVGVWTGASTDRDRREPLVKAWSQPLTDGARAVLIKTTPDAAYFAIIKESDGTIVKVSGSPLEAKWRSEPLSKVFGAADTRGLRNVPGVRPGFDTPAEGETQPTNLIVVMDERTLVLVQRAGKAAAYDTDTGDLLWSARIGVGRVYDADLSGGTLAVGGDQEIYATDGKVTDLKPVIQIADARTGRSAQKIDRQLGGHVRWVGFTEAGSLIAALDASVVCLDLASAQPNWTISHADAMPVSSMWIFGDQLVMADQNRGLWLASISTGRLRQAALEMPRSHLDLSQTMDAFPLAAVPGSGFGVATQQGIVLFGPDGTHKGGDGMDGTTSMVRPRPADGRAIAIETLAAERTTDGLMTFILNSWDCTEPTWGTLIDKRSVVLGARPSTIALLDGRIAISAGSTTVVVRAPGQ